MKKQAMRKGVQAKGTAWSGSMPGILEEWPGLPCDWCQVSEWEESSVESAGEWLEDRSLKAL